MVVNERERLISKAGDSNIKYRTILGSNPFTIDSAFLRSFLSSFLISGCVYLYVWNFFALLYFLMEYFNGTICDGPTQFERCWLLNEDNHYRNLTKAAQDEYINDQRCVIGIFDYKSALLFSVETMSTIGFGGRFITTKCITSVFLLLNQSIIGIVLPTVWTAVIIAKFKCSFNVFSVRFSAKAAITLEEGKYFLNVKIAPLDATHGILLEASADGVVVTRRRTMVSGDEDEEEEEEEIDLKVMTFNIDQGQQKTKFHVMWPTIISHEIDRNSPLHDFNSGMPGSDNFELVLILKGSTIYDGSTVVQRTSYLPSEIVGVGKFSFEHVFQERADYISINEQKQEFDFIESKS